MSIERAKAKESDLIWMIRAEGARERLGLVD